MSGDRGYPYWLSFLLTVGVSVADEITVGPVWGPAVVEGLSLEASAFVFVRAWAVASRVPLREGLAVDEAVPQGDLLTSVAADGLLVRARTGIVMSTAGSRWIAMGSVVTWAPWYLVVRVENVGVAATDVSGQFALRVFDAVRVPVESRSERRVGWWHQGRVLGGGNPDGLVAGYRGGF